MRIISGYLGGRNFASPRGHRTHPMSDKMRGAIFNVLGDIKGLTVLDAFAGSGALSFEALSRGAKYATAVEIDKEAYITVRDNAEILGVADKMDIVRARASGWSDKKQTKQFDLIFCDPPYDNLQIRVLQKLSRHVGSDSVFVLSWPGHEDLPLLPLLEVVKQNPHGDGQLIFYRLAKQG